MSVLKGTVRSSRVKTVQPPDPEAIATVLRRAHMTLDLIDEGKDTWFNSSLNQFSSARDDARAWAWACLLLIDECDIDSVTVAAIATRIWKGRQDVLDIF